jgi:hypothetical protein
MNEAGTVSTATLGAFLQVYDLERLQILRDVHGAPAQELNACGRGRHLAEHHRIDRRLAGPVIVARLEDRLLAAG